jgi:hypothetical protein
MARTTLATGSAPSNRALTQRMPPSAKWRRTVSSRTAIEAMCDLPTPPSPLRTITCHRTSSARHQHVIRGSSEGHQGAIREPLGGHQRANRVSTEGHQRVIRGSSESHRTSSERPQRVVRGSSESQSPTRTLTVASPLVIASTSLGYIPTRCTWRALSSAGASCGTSARTGARSSSSTGVPDEGGHHDEGAVERPSRGHQAPEAHPHRCDRNQHAISMQSSSRSAPAQMRPRCAGVSNFLRRPRRWGGVRSSAMGCTSSSSSGSTNSS